MKMQCIFNCFGICLLYQNCFFENYCVECEGQMNVLSKVCQYVEEFDGNIVSFIFFGKLGIGKNYLVVVICNELLLCGKFVLIIIVVDIMLVMKDIFRNSGISEE